ncbi:MAG TPA: class I SAM-dependent methyltransferase [Pseudonocardiaceae bacterium]|nr:class I SAM-dependent methyltransferase [Pseudonocardiaceae bacterium]
MGVARYDGHADWYDTTFRHLADGSAGLLAALLGRPDPAHPLCVDIGCGTGLHTAAVRSAGHTVLGVDLSADQLRVAFARNPLVVRADAARLPLPDHCAGAVVMTFTHTDVDDFSGVVAEAARVLRPGGRLVYIGLHPAYVGAFVDRHGEAADRRLTFSVGYGDEQRHVDPTGRFPVRSRVGARNLTLATFLGAFLAQPSLSLVGLTELDTEMRPWRVESVDGRIVPWNLAVTAVGR